MSIEQETTPTTKTENKTSVLKTIKIMLGVIVMFLLIILLTAVVLYFTNAKAKKLIDTKILKSRLAKSKTASSKIISDPRISELADYYLKMTDDQAADKLEEILKNNKKAYKNIFSSMSVINPEKTARISEIVKARKSKKDIIKTEYDQMLKNTNDENRQKSAYYSSLGVKGAIDAIESELKVKLKYDDIAVALEDMQPNFVAKILYYINPMYKDGLKNRLSNSYLKDVEEQTQTYLEFLRKNQALGKVYGELEESMAAKKLENKKNFNDEQLAVIFSNMDYMNAAKILNKFEDESRVDDILTQIKNIEDYQFKFEGSFSTVLSNTIKILKKYDKDVDTLKRAYEKMQAEDLAKVIDKMLTNNPIYKTYDIDSKHKFSISEKKLIVDTLKKTKPALVGQVITELKNEDKLDKAAYLCRELGIPNPAEQ